MDDLRIPDFLIRQRSAQPLHLLLSNISRRRYRVRRVGRPDGQRWESAELVEVFLKDEAPSIGCGPRPVLATLAGLLLWVPVGTHLMRW